MHGAVRRDWAIHIPKKWEPAGATNYLIVFPNHMIGYPVVRRELRSYGYSYSLLNIIKWGAKELPRVSNHILVGSQCFFCSNANFAHF
jgi:hypothetical protein